MANLVHAALTAVESFFGHLTKQRLEFGRRDTVTDDCGDQRPHVVVRIFDQATVNGGISADSIAAVTPGSAGAG